MLHWKHSSWRYAGASTWQFCGRLYIVGFNTAVFTDPQHRASLERAESEWEGRTVKGRRLFRQPCWSRPVVWQTRARASAWRPRVIAVHAFHIYMSSCHSVCCSVNSVSLWWTTRCYRINPACGARELEHRPGTVFYYSYGTLSYRRTNEWRVAMCVCMSIRLLRAAFYTVGHKNTPKCVSP